MPELAALVVKLRERFRDVITDDAVGIDMPVVTIRADGIVDVMTALRDAGGLVMLTDITAVDWLPRHPRYDVNYHLLWLDENQRLRVKVPLEDAEELHMPSVTGVFPGADWHEREVFDFFGVTFAGHPNMKRILMPDEWVGYPLRKDYPVGGVPVEYRIEPAYVGSNVVTEQARPSAGGVPARLRRDRGRMSHYTWTGAPASGVRKTEPVEGHELSEEGKES
jgi:NADH-quinone oxidoreductase subunit C